MSLMPIITPSIAPPELSYEDYDEDPANQSSYIFSAMTAGTAASNRYLIAVAWWVGWGSSRTLSSATISGVSGTVLIQNTGGGANPVGMAIFIAAVPTGTTATVVINLSGGCLTAGTALYRAVGLKLASAHDTDSNTGDPIDLSINVQKGGIILGGAFAQNSTSGITTTGLIEDHEQNAGSGVNRVVYASLSEATAETGRSVQFNSTGSPATMNGLCASLR